MKARSFTIFFTYINVLYTTSNGNVTRPIVYSVMYNMLHI